MYSHMMFESLNSNMVGFTSGAGTVEPSGSTRVHPSSSWFLVGFVFLNLLFLVQGQIVLTRCCIGHGEDMHSYIFTT
jgi:hypothetical protein